MYDYLLISLLFYDEVSSSLLLVKLRNSSFLIGRSICLSWSVHFCGFTWPSLISLCTNKTQREHVFYCKNKFTDKLISAVGNEFSAEFGILVLSTLEKYQQFSHCGPWPAIYDTRRLAFRKINGNSLCFCWIFSKSSLYMFTNEVNFCCLSKIQIRCCNYFRLRRIRGLCGKLLSEKENRLFYTHIDFQQDCSLAISRIIKINKILLKFSSSYGNYLDFSCYLYDSRTKDPRARSPFFRITWKIFPFGACHFKIIVRSINLSSGKISARDILIHIRYSRL